MRGLVLLPMLLLAACHDKPSFDERYDKAAKEVEARAKRMDAAGRCTRENSLRRLCRRCNPLRR